MTTPETSPALSGSAPPNAASSHPDAVSPVAYMLVFAGGAVGAGLALLLRLNTSGIMSFPLLLALCNIIGSFCLGVLVGRIRVGSHPARLFFGTGLLGSFTSFSALSASMFPQLGSAETHVLSPLLAGIVSLILGVVGAWAGLRVGRRGAARTPASFPRPSSMGTTSTSADK